FGFSATLNVEEIFIPNFSLFLDFLVSITITPLPALAPQIEDAAASFSKVMDAISIGLISLISRSKGKPSTIINGEAFEFIVETPLNLNLGVGSTSLII